MVSEIRNDHVQVRRTKWCCFLDYDVCVATSGWTLKVSVKTCFYCKEASKVAPWVRFDRNGMMKGVTKWRISGGNVRKLIQLNIAC